MARVDTPALILLTRRAPGRSCARRVVSSRLWAMWLSVMRRAVSFSIPLVVGPAGGGSRESLWPCFRAFPMADRRDRARPFAASVDVGGQPAPVLRDLAGDVACVDGYTMHEFGHALGFQHEQDQPDSTCETEQPEQRGKGTSLTAYDHYSVMNYCAPNYWTSPQLSPSDIFGALGPLRRSRRATHVHPTAAPAGRRLAARSPGA